MVNGPPDVLKGGLEAELSELTGPNYKARTLISQMIRRNQRGQGVLNLDYKAAVAHGLSGRLPNAADQLDSLILMIGGAQPQPGKPARLTPLAISAYIGAMIDPSANDADRNWLVQRQETIELIERWGDFQTAGEFYRLTLKGWQRYDQLTRGQVESRTAFMAMKFGQPDMDAVVESCFKPAAEHAGFKLRPVNEDQAAGIIDDQMRVALRQSRFVIADITHGSHGAYWEAGFAEGLGRPVIYTCRRAEWTEGKSHFDTNHLVTIVWEPGDLAGAMRRLTATIRATLPGEASMLSIEEAFGL